MKIRRRVVGRRCSILTTPSNPHITVSPQFNQQRLNLSFLRWLDRRGLLQHKNLRRRVFGYIVISRIVVPIEKRIPEKDCPSESWSVAKSTRACAPAAPCQTTTVHLRDGCD